MKGEVPMGYLMIPILICLVIAYALACYLEQPLSYTIPGTIISIDVILFLFYIFNTGNAGIGMIVLIAVISLGYIGYRTKRKKLSRIDFPVILFIIGLIGVCFYCKGNIVREWDSLRLWGAYPKALYYTAGKLQLGENASVWINKNESTYIPGMPLLSYFFEAFFPRFREDVLFVVYAFLNMSFILPALGRMKRKKTMIIGLPLMILMPLLFYNSGYNATNYYKVLYIDPCLGMALGYMTYSMAIWNVEDKASIFNLLMSMCCTILLKDMGVIFAIIILGGCGIKMIQQRKIFKVRNAVYLLPFLLYFVWGIVTSLHGVSNHAASFEWNNLFMGDSIKEFIYYISHEILIITGHGRLNPYFTIVNFMLFFVVCGIALQVIMKKADVKENYFASLVSMLIIQIVYIVCLYVSTITFDSTYMSTIRYESALMLGFFAFLVFNFIANWDVIIVYIMKKKIWGGLIIGACLCILVAFPLREPMELESPVFEKAEYASEELRQILARQKGVEENGLPVKVCVLYDGYESHIYQRIYFILIGEVDVLKTSGCLIHEERSKEENIEVFLDKLDENNCEYVFTLDNATLLDQYKYFFEDSLDDYTLYQIVQSGEKSILSKVEN